MRTFSRFCLLAFFLSAVSVAAAHAQMPEDNDYWKSRCTKLTAQDATIQTGTLTPDLIAYIHGIPSVTFTTIGFNRSKAGEHQVACTLFYMAAIAERQAGPSRIAAARNRAIVAEAEYRLSKHLKVTMTEHLKRAEEEAGQMTAPMPTPDQVQAVIDAASVVPASTSTPAAK